RPAIAHQPRRFADFLLTSTLGEDALGRVFRGLTLGDAEGFVRLRVLATPEVPRSELVEAAETAGRWLGNVRGASIARATLGVDAGIPFVAWREAHGWSLGTLLAGLRAAGEKLPMVHALLIGDRIAAGLAEAARTAVGGGQLTHGLLWPEFVSLSKDGEVFVGGFGLARAILPHLSAERLRSAVLPYVAPELRDKGAIHPGADVYSVGAILLEMLTGRRLEASAPKPDPRAEDAWPADLARLLRVALAPQDLRYASIVEFRRDLGRVLVAGGFRLSSFELARYLAERLPAESIAIEGSLPELPDLSNGPTEGPEEVDEVLARFWERAES
ncbi:MAG TPA: protein kinase, partial [Thermoanaerobaculia bacterium]